MSEEKTLTLALGDLYAKIKSSRINIITSLNEIGEDVSFTTKTSELPNIIKNLNVDDGAFKAILNFDMDWQINPKVPRSGNVGKGLFLDCNADIIQFSTPMISIVASDLKIKGYKSGWRSNSLNIVSEQITISSAYNLKINDKEQIKDTLQPNNHLFSESV
jgi:hypothetical protein